MTASSQRSVTRRDLTVAAACGVFVAVMVGASYAAVPLYDWFCRTTGFGGRTQVATAAPSGVLGREVTVRFDSNIAAGLPWRFEPEQNEIKARLGEVVTVNYKVRNLTARETAGQASYNVSPPQAGYYFHKINCFCFTEQEMKPGEARDMAVVFYVDPALAKDADQAKLDTITLSYTFYSMPTKQAEIPSKASGRL